MRVHVFLLLVLLTVACISDEDTTDPAKTTKTTVKKGCTVAEDCFHRRVGKCMGYWTCVEGKCLWYCDTILDPVNVVHRSLSYSISDCNVGIRSDRADAVIISNKDNKIIINQSLNYYCCAALELKVSRKKNVYTITEYNRGKACRCRCNHQINAELKMPGKGRYIIRVMGVDFMDDEVKLLKKKTVNLI